MYFNKYKNTRVIVDGIKFDSKAESEYYLHLCQMLKLGLIESFERQPKVYLSKAKILIKPDFVITENGKTHYVDVKGVLTPVFSLKARLWAAYMDKPLKLVKKYAKGFREIKVINPEVINLG